MHVRQKITPFLWFDNQAEQAASFYVSLFKDSKIIQVTRYTEAGPGPAGSAMIVEFQLAGLPFIALNGGPHFKFTEAISFVVNCKTQAEINRYCKKLAAPGSKMQCGWLKDKYGVSWQIVPVELGELLGNPDPEKAQRAMQAMLKMSKLDVEALHRASA